MKVFYHHQQQSLIYTQIIFERLDNARFYTCMIRVDYNQFDGQFCSLRVLHYIEEVEKMISDHAPLRKTRKRELKFQSKTWITSGGQKSTVIKNRLFGKFIKSTNSIIK